MLRLRFSVVNRQLLAVEILNENEVALVQSQLFLALCSLEITGRDACHHAEAVLCVQGHFIGIYRTIFIQADGHVGEALLEWELIHRCIGIFVEAVGFQQIQHTVIRVAWQLVVVLVAVTGVVHAVWVIFVNVQMASGVGADTQEIAIADTVRLQLVYHGFTDVLVPLSDHFPVQVIDEHLAEGADGQAVFQRLRSRSVNVQRRVILIERLCTGIGHRIQLPAVNLLYQPEDALVQAVINIIICTVARFVANQRLIVILENVQLIHVVGDESNKMSAHVDIIGTQLFFLRCRYFISPIQGRKQCFDRFFIRGVEIEGLVLLGRMNIQATEGRGERPSAIFGWNNDRLCHCWYIWYCGFGLDFSRRSFRLGQIRLQQEPAVVSHTHGEAIGLDDFFYLWVGVVFVHVVSRQFNGDDVALFNNGGGFNDFRIIFCGQIAIKEIVTHVNMVWMIPLTLLIEHRFSIKSIDNLTW